MTRYYFVHLFDVCDKMPIEASVKAGVIPTLIKLLQSPYDDYIGNSLHYLSKIASHSVKFRDIVLNAGVMQPVLDTIEKQGNKYILREAINLIFNLFRGEPHPDKELIFPALPTLVRLLMTSNKEIIIDVSRVLSDYSDGPNNRIEDIINSGVCNRLADLLYHPSKFVIVPVLKTIGNIVAGDDKQTEFIANISVLHGLLHLLSSKHYGVKREACWILSNICGGNRELIQSVIDANIIPKVIEIIANENECYKVKVEALWLVNNVFSCGSKNQVNYIIGQGCMPPICNLLDNCKEIRVLRKVLAVIKNLLNSAKDTSHNPYIECIESCDGFEKVKLYFFHYGIDIANSVIDILNYKYQLYE